MIELSTYHQGFVSGSFSGLVMGLGLMKMAWEHKERKRRQPATRRSSSPLPPELDSRFGVRLDEGRIQSGNGHGGPSTPKPEIIPRPTFRPDWSPCSQPPINPPPESP